MIEDRFFGCDLMGLEPPGFKEFSKTLGKPGVLNCAIMARNTHWGRILGAKLDEGESVVGSVGCAHINSWSLHALANNIAERL